ncbi:site-specific integrase [Vibrio anguillarum]|uniref:tyrosine-type recombinase/integrase n=2 Tax=Vibrio anguillarum TaxID=55601 RepID=UPI0018C30330|nr:site-specific integrase [Vibrio anguillarum]MBF4341269.1 site-specific integrase [Vibrio anguillarum]
MSNNIVFYPLYPPASHFDVPMPDANILLRRLSKDGMESVTQTYFYVMQCLETVLPTKNTYNAMRGDINILCNWSWLVAKKDIIDLSLKDINEFIIFCNSPPKELIGKYSASLIDAKKSMSDYVEVNPNWSPFVNHNFPAPYKRTEQTLKVQLSNLSFVYTYFEDVEYSFRNPAAVALRRMTSAVKQNLKHDRSEVGDKGLSSLQLSYVLDGIDKLAMENPEKHERTRFLFYLLIFCYPRISECSARAAYSPLMGDFEYHRRLENQDTYFTFYIPNSKGGKSRKVICAPILIEALIRYRRHRGLSDLPTSNEETPIFVRHRPGTHGREKNMIDANLGTDQIAALVKEVFQYVANALEVDGYTVDADDLRANHTTHSLRHTGIQIDLSSGRDKTHIMLDAGHASESTLAIYTSKRTEFRAESVQLKNNFMSKVIKKDVAK